MTAPTTALQIQPVKVLTVHGLSATKPEWVRGSLSKEALERVCVIVLGSDRTTPSQLIEQFSRTHAVLALGPSGEAGWREAAMEAGAFGCLSESTPEEDRTTLLQAAAHHQKTRGELAELRKECERLCFELVSSFGGAMEKLAHAKSQSGRLRGFLEETQLRIVQALI